MIPYFDNKSNIDFPIQRKFNHDRRTLFKMHRLMLLMRSTSSIAKGYSHLDKVAKSSKTESSVHKKPRGWSNKSDASSRPMYRSLFFFLQKGVSLIFLFSTEKGRALILD